MESETTERLPVNTLSSTDEAEVLAEYRSVSPLALVGFAMGLASPLVFVADLLMALPLFGIAISLLALAKIHASKGQIVGQSLATIGLVLSLVSVCAMKSHSWGVEALLSRQARPVAERWIQHVAAGELEKAYSLTSAAERAKKPAAPGPPGMPTEAPYDAFINKPVVQSLLRFGENSSDELPKPVLLKPVLLKPMFLKTVASERMPAHNRVLQLYRVTQESAAADEERLEVGLMLQQSAQGEQPAVWRIESYNQSPE